MSSPSADHLERLAGFGRALRRAGLPAGTGAMLDFCRAAALLAPEELYWAGRVTLVTRAEDRALYDRVFVESFGTAPQRFERAPRERELPAQEPVRAGMELAPAAERDGDDPQVGLASSVELLRHKSFASFTTEELQELLAACGELLVPTRRTRRYRAAQGGRIDLRRTLRASWRTGGEPLDRAWRRRSYKPRRVVLLLDVSGSMTSYSRALLFFAHAGVRAGRGWEVFCFATRLTRVTRALAAGTPDEALRHASEHVVDWDGGTRIGASLQRLLDDRERGTTVRGAIAIICSDGLELDEPDLLREQMGRLARLAHRVIWLNPLKEDPAYEPLARGMRAALPHVDVFASGHDVASLEALSEALSGTAPARSRTAPARSGPSVT
jgi:uncharacterized protein